MAHNTPPLPNEAPNFTTWPSTLAHLRFLHSLVDESELNHIREIAAHKTKNFQECGEPVRTSAIATRGKTFAVRIIKPMLDVKTDELIEAEKKGVVGGNETQRLWEVVSRGRALFEIY